MAFDDIEKQYQISSHVRNGDLSNKFSTLSEVQNSTDIDDDALHVSTDKLARNLSARQVQMIAIGGTIGTGLFLGTGKSLSKGGPASMLISYAICGGIVFVTMLSLGEMAAFIPVAGSFCTFAG